MKPTKIEMLRETNGRFNVSVYVQYAGGWTGNQVATNVSHTVARLIEKSWFDSFMTDEKREAIVLGNLKLEW